jgi:hypothetical protein
MSAVVTAALLSPVSNEVQIATVIAHGAVTGGTLSLAIALLFEILGRGVSTVRRGHALGLGYGIGPIFAVVGALIVQWVLPTENDGTVGGYTFLFAASVPVVCLAAVISGLFIIPLPEHEHARVPFWQGVFGGLGEYLATPVLRHATTASVLVLAGYCCLDNMTLYTRRVLGTEPEAYVGYQQGLRFSFKIATGLMAGWLLTRSHPKALLLLTAMIGVAAVSWALCSSGLWYLVSFGLLGGGELFSVYILNYVLTSSPPKDIRRNLGFAVLLLMLVVPFGPIYGAISDHIGALHSAELGFRAGFATALAILLLGLAATLRLPAHPRPTP